MSQIYIAHINEKTKKIQTVKEHSENTAKLCRDFAISPLKDFMYVLGLYHDIGKMQPSFQKKIRGANIRVEHSACGAIAAKEDFPYILGLMMEYCIAGHHSGIPDAGSKCDTPDKSSLYGRIRRSFEDYSMYKKELAACPVDQSLFMDFLLQDCREDRSLLVDKFAFLTRYCFSCLVDADSLDTAEFCGEGLDRQMMADFPACLQRVNDRLNSFVCQTSLQRSRALLQQQVFQKADQDAEIYLMNMPTGSGKTLASIKFALERGIRGKKKRIIYIIPYNSIIDQTAEEFETLFQGCGEILRHQSTFSYENEDEDNRDEDYIKAAKKAAENWDAPLIITTMVQFFDSIYDNKRRKLRKLHNMADSILVFDEAHLMPVEYLKPCLQGIAYITRYLNSEAVFLTATMPDFSNLMKQYAWKNSRILTLIQDTSPFSQFQKCSYQYVGKISEESLLERTFACPSSLIIVNSKKKARRIYGQCSGKKYHLSTYMTAHDRKRVLFAIREELRCLEEEFPDDKHVPKERRITIVSTSLIEAGVDLDVHTVFRELNGLDSILQAGGRCNREGKRENAQVVLFELEEDNGIKGNECINMVRGILRKYSDISCPECIQEYYKRLFDMKSQVIQENRITKRCHNIDSIPFKTYAEDFRLIDSRTTVSLVVPIDAESRELVEKLRYAGAGLARKLQLYTCSVCEKELNDLIRQHVAEDFGTGIYCLTNPDYYNQETGVVFEAKDYIMD